ncbi:MAG: UDP-3-O-acyl-N-acetylglucosamine deacetylase [Planctomycetota bacterium]
MTPPRTIRGIGLFTGADTAVTIETADAPAGITLIADGIEIPATIASLSEHPVHPAFAAMPPRHTVLGLTGASVATTEHMLAALAGAGVWSARVRVDGPEVPIMDGSGAPFAGVIGEAGGPGPEPITLDHDILIEDGDARIVARPSGSPRYEYRLDYGDAAPAAMRRSSASWRVGDREGFLTEVAPARTFSMLHEVEAMRSLGLFERFTPRDLLVLGPDGPIENTLRFEDEPARHKLLDLIGDLALLGAPLHAEVIAERSGHRHTHELVRRVLETRGEAGR